MSLAPSQLPCPPEGATPAFIVHGDDRESLGSFRESRAESLVLALIAAIGATTLTRWAPFVQAWSSNVLGLKAVPWDVYRDVLFLGFGLLLAGSAPRRSGLQIGTVRAEWRRVLLVNAVPPAFVALVYPFLPVRPFAGASFTMWLVSPLAQTLFFAGFLYGRLEPAFPGYVHPRCRIRWALVVMAAFFALAHVPNFVRMPAGFVLFQLFCTGVLYLIPALSRQWTGSILYVALCHSAVNFVALYAS